MSSKTYTVRVPLGTPDVTGETVATWLDAQLSSNAPLAADPGAGERTFRLSLDQDKVEAGAQVTGEPVAVFLRRLIASQVPVPGEPDKPELEAKPKPLVLKGANRLRAEQVMPAVRLLEAGQSFVIRRALRSPEAVQEAAYTDEERDLLAASGAELLNRRAPRQLVENIDIVGFGVTLIAIEVKKIEAVQAVAERKRQQAEPPTQPHCLRGDCDRSLALPGRFAPSLSVRHWPAPQHTNLRCIRRGSRQCLEAHGPENYGRSPYR